MSSTHKNVISDSGTSIPSLSLGLGLSAVFSIYKKAIRDSRTSLISLSLGLGLYAILLVSFFPAIIEQAETLNELISSYPSEFMAFFTGGDDISTFDFTNPGTFIQTEFVTWMLLILGAMVIVQAFNAVTNAERDGSMDMILSLPVSRRQFLLGRILATVTMLLVVLTAVFIGFAIGAQIWPEFDVRLDTLALGIYGAFLPLMVIAGFAYLLVTVVPSSRRFAGAIAYLMLIGSYLVLGLTQIDDSIEGLRPALVFYYYNARDLMNIGVEPEKWAVLIGVAALYFFLAWWFIDHKELGV